MAHSAILNPSLWRVFPFSLSSLADMPSLTTVALNEYIAFSWKQTIHTKSSSLFSSSFLDITSALSYFLSFPLSFTHFSSMLIVLIAESRLQKPSSTIKRWSPLTRSKSIAKKFLPTKDCVFYCLLGLLLLSKTISLVRQNYSWNTAYFGSSLFCGD